VTELDRARAESVQADLVRMHQSAAGQIIADELNLHMSAAGEVRASMVEGHEAALGLVSANEVWMTNSAAGAVQGDNVVVDGGSAVVLARNVSLHNAYTGVVADQQVQADEIRTVILLGGKVDGPVHTSLDTRQTILAGLIGGVIAGTILAVARLFMRRD
jgi:hypothetical protein